MPTFKFRPMLASPADLNNLKFPLLASPKLDGIRAVVINGVLMSRSLKPIPNLHTQKLFGKYEHLDGELIVGLPTAKDCFRETTSGVMSIDKEPNVEFHVFDHVEHPQMAYSARESMFAPKCFLGTRVHVVKQTLVKSLEELLALEEKRLNEGYEGLILRDPLGPYKFGRSTTKEGILLKLKRFTDDEAVIIGFVEQMHNGNEATTNELGRTKRSSHQENKTGKNTLGALAVRWGDIEFEIGTGMDDELRQRIWSKRDQYEGKLVKFKHFPVGAKDKPRHPVFLGFRDSKDL